MNDVTEGELHAADYRIEIILNQFFSPEHSINIHEIIVCINDYLKHTRACSAGYYWFQK